MKPRLNRKNKRRLIIAVGVAAVIVLILVLLPIGLRWGTAKWLTDQGVVTQIEDIDLNLFTGTLAITNARGKNEQGQGFSIKHALVNLRYWPLFSKQIYLSDLELADSRVDVKLGKDGQIMVAGLALGGGEEKPPPEDKDSTPWGFGLDRAAIGNVTLHYQQPDFDREITLSSSSSSNIATWQPNQPIPVNAQLGIGKGTISLRGQVKPFGDQIIGDIHLGIKNFDLDLVAPLAKQAGVGRLAGQVNSALQIKIDYRTEGGLALDVAGDAGLAGASIGMPDLDVNNADIQWQGKINARLLSQQPDADQIKANGHLSVDKLDVALPQTLAFSQANTDWKGEINATLDAPMTVLADGALKVKTTHLDVFETPAAATVTATDAATEKPEPEAQTQTDENNNSQAPEQPEQTASSTDEHPAKPAEDPATDTQAAAQDTPKPQPEKNSQAAAPDAAPATTETSPAQESPEKPPVTDNDTTEVAISGKDAEKPLHTPQNGPKTLTFDQDSTGWKGTINLSLAKLGPKLSANGHLTTANTHLLLPADKTEIKQGSIDWQGNLEMTPGDKGPSVKTKGKLATTGTDLSLPASSIALQQQSVNWAGTADYGPGAPALVHASGALAADGLQLTQQAMVVTGGHFEFNGNVALDPNAEGMPANAKLPLAVSGKFDGADITVSDAAGNKTLGKVDGFKLADINIAGLNNIRSGLVTANGLAALERAKNAPHLKDYPYITTVKTLAIKQLALTNQSRLAMTNVDIDGIDALLYRGTDGAVEASQWFANPADEDTSKVKTPAEQSTTQPQAEPASFQIALGRGLIHDSHITIDDRGVEPAFDTTLSNLHIAMADMDSAKPDQGSALNISSTLGRYGSIKADGFIKPFLQPPSASLTGKINAINLAPISGYTAQAIDRRIDRGTFSADLKFNLDRGNIDANAKLKLTKLRIGGAQTDAGVVQKKLGLPLNKILGLLRDGDGNITLNLPVGGDIENPEFSIMGIVRKAIFKSLQSAVLVIYAPLGILKAGAGRLMNLGEALRPDPILFEPGQVTLDSSDKTFLDKTAALMTKRPNTELVVCGHVVPADRTAMQLPTAKTAEGETPATPEQLASARDMLLALASQRSGSVGDYLVSKGIAAPRLVLCNPALGEEETALPRTTLQF